MKPRAKHCFLTLVGNNPLLNLVLDNGDLISIEITESHLSNLLQDGVRIAFRPDKITGERK